MTIASAIENARNKIATAYQTVESMGGTLPATQNLENLPTAIESVVTTGPLIDGSVTEVDTSVSSIRGSAFANCTSLNTVILRSNTVVDLSDESIFENTPIASKTGNIYVPDELVDSYKGDTENWTFAVQDSQLAAQTGWQSITYGKGKFLAKCGNYLSSSTDGINWGVPYEINYLYRTNYLAYGNGTFISLGQGAYLSTSQDGINWVEPYISGITWSGTFGIRDLIYDGSKFVALVENGNSSGYSAIWTSTNGTNWTLLYQATSTFEYAYKLAYNGSLYLSVGENGLIYTSSNLINWSRVSGGSYDHYFTSGLKELGFDGSRFFGTANGKISYTTDGVVWTTPATDSRLGNYTWVDSITSGLKIVLISSDGYISIKNIGYNFLPISQLPTK